jgi:NAD-dependent dihydropyrimidine dehydrogenase PreA subunit
MDRPEYIIPIRTGRIIIDHSVCEGCESYECAKACSLYGRNIIRIKNGKPIVLLGSEEIRRRDNECLACEIHCPFNAVRIILDMGEV